MNKAFLTATAMTLTLAASAVSAQGFSFDGAEASFTKSYSNDAYTGEDISLSGQVSFGRVGVQVDVNRWGYDNEYEWNGYTAHLFYDVSDTVTAGVFYNNDLWGPTYGSQGLEAAVDLGAISLEAAAGVYQIREGSSYSFNFVDIDAGYDFGNNLSASVGLMRSQGSVDMSVVELAARYEFSDAFAEVGISRMSGDYDQQILSVEIGYQFGSGTTFDDRGWNGLFGLY